MRIPESLASLSEYGIIEEVLRPLMSGKEAQIYLVISGNERRVAKVYKEAQSRSFRHRAEYTEGRKVRNSRDQRAMGKGSRHGRAQTEAAWRSTEVETIYRLRDAGVRVPEPYHFIDGVLVMELVTDEEGNPAPRLGDLSLELAEAEEIFARLLAEVVRMLCAGVVHGDLSGFNVLMGARGPVIIDFPQAVDASSNQNARKLLLRDVENLHDFMARFDPERKRLPYAQEMWQLYERGELTPDTRLSGRHQASERKADTAGVLALIGDAAHDERRRREQLGLSMRGTANAPGGNSRDPRDARSERGRDPRDTKPIHVSPPPQKRPQHTGERPQHAAQRPQHAVQRPQHTGERPQHAAQRPQHTAERPQHMAQRPQHAVQRPQHTAERPQHAVQRPQHTAERPQHAEQRPQHTAERPQHAVQRPQHTAERPQHAEQRPQHTAQRPQHATPSAAGAAPDPGAQKRRRRRRRRGSGAA